MPQPTQAQIEALELIDTFAWSCVKTDCEESRVELQRRIDKCRAALTAAPKADVRFREFGNGATWVDFPMTQDSAQTTPTQAQTNHTENRSIIHRIKWKLVGFGIGVRPFWWQLGHFTVAETHWFNVGPLFVQWKVPLK